MKPNQTDKPMSEFEEVEKNFEDVDRGAPSPVDVRIARVCRGCRCWDRSKPVPKDCPGRKMKSEA